MAVAKAFTGQKGEVALLFLSPVAPYPAGNFDVDGIDAQCGDATKHR